MTNIVLIYYIVNFVRSIMILGNNRMNSNALHIRRSIEHNIKIKKIHIGLGD